VLGLGKEMRIWLFLAAVAATATLLLLSPVSGVFEPIQNRITAVQFSKNFSAQKNVQVIAESLYLDYLNDPCQPEAIIPLARFSINHDREDVFLEISVAALQSCDLPNSTVSALAIEIIPKARSNHNIFAREVAINALSRSRPNSIQTIIERASFHTETENYEAAIVDFFKLFSLAPRDSISVNLHNKYYDALFALQRYCDAAAVYETLRGRPNLRGTAFLETKIQNALQAGDCQSDGGGNRNAHNIRLNANGQFIASVMINDLNGEFLIDTGANVSIAKESFAERSSIENISTDRFSLRGIGGDVEAGLGRARSVAIGGMSTGVLEFALVRDSDVSFSFDGILGMDFIRRFDWDISQSMITLTQR
jgi:predicted aspartyl protease